MANQLKSINKAMSLLTILCLVCPPAYSTDYGNVRENMPTTPTPTHPYSRAEEYYSEQVPGEALITVHIFGAVSRSGVYHVPRNTDLFHLLSLAGGSRTDADLRRVSIKRRNKAEEQILKVNVVEMAEKAGVRAAVLEAGDVVLVYTKDPLIGSDTLSAITVIASLLSIFTTAIVLTKQLR